MKYYAGLDVSLEETAVCVVDSEGTILREGMVASEPSAIAEFLSSFDFSLKLVGLEAGSLSPWLYHELLDLGFPVVCMETRHAKSVLKAQLIKTDRNDARGLAHMLRTGWFRSVHVKSHESQKLRVLLNNRRFLVEQRRDIENQIRGTLKVFGLKIGKVGKLEYAKRVCELLSEDKTLLGYVEPLLKVRDEIMQHLSKLDDEILGLAKEDEACCRLMTVPGVGPITALAFRVAIDRPERFKKSRDVGVHLGLTPRKYASGQVDYDGHISKCGDALVRSYLYEAAKVLMGRVKKWSVLKARGMQIAKRSSRKNACVAVARKLSVIMHRMWLEGTDFQYSRETEEAVAA